MCVVHIRVKPHDNMENTHTHLHIDRRRSFGAFLQEVVAVREELLHREV